MQYNDSPTKEQFLNDVEKHQMTILKDDGLYRHIHFGMFNDSNRSFSITTFPNYLAITGDMGDFVFSRIDDMFEFFNTTDINPDYWAQKVVSQSIFGDGIYHFDIELFKNNIINYIKSYLDLEENEELPEIYLDDISSILSAEDEIDCINELRNFYPNSLKSNVLADFWMDYSYNSCRSFNYNYMWCCYAIQYAISKYAEFKNL